MAKKYKSDAFAAIHEAASDMYELGAMDKNTMKRFDEACLTPVEKLSAEEIRAIREKEQASQAVFARHLNVSPLAVSQWERGERSPSGASLKLLTLVKVKGLGAVA